MKKIIVVLQAMALAVLVSGCASTGLTASTHVTSVQLNSANFRVIATNIAGEASSEAVLGVSYGLGIGATQLALIPLTGDRMLYKTAMQNLWTNFEARNGAVANRKLALVNIRYDSESLNLFFYTKVTTTVVADVVEFE